MPTDMNVPPELVESEPATIPFTLSEQSMALYPPLENHAGAYPKLSTPTCAPTPNTAVAIDDAGMGSNSDEEAYPLCALKKGVRTDSYGAFDVSDGEDAFPLSSKAANRSASNLMMLAAQSYPPPPHRHGPIVIVSSYTNFSDLAHGPRGLEATRAVRTYRLDMVDGALTLLSAVPEGLLHNPAFSRRHPSLNVVYACTESVQEDGQVVALELDGKNGALKELCPPVSAGGTSTCFLTIHKKARRMLLCNYWDSTIVTLELLPDGKLGRQLSLYDPKNGKPMKARADKHVNHSLNDENAQAERQGDPHSHAIVLEPRMGCMAYVPDLGMDVIRQFWFDEESGCVTPCGVVSSGIKVGRRGLGPRYIVFNETLHACYVVNELSSQVAVFKYHDDVVEAAAKAMAAAPTAEAKDAIVSAMAPTLTLVQTVSTVPEAFPSEMNTCGRVALHPSGNFVVTSNRGHDSVAVHRIHRDSTPPGMLTLAGIFHTRGETPRHFQFDRSGQWLLVANQDSNTTAVFAFNVATGRVTYTGNTYPCPSPNFVCVWDGA